MIGTLVILLALLLTVSGAKYLRLVRSLTVETSAMTKTYQLYLKKVAICLILIASCLFLVLILLVLFTFFGTNGIVWLSIHFGLRILEFVIVGAFLAVLYQKRPSDTQSNEYASRSSLDGETASGGPTPMVSIPTVESDLTK